MKPPRTFVLFYGCFCYLLHWVITLYLIGFIGDVWLTKSVDGTPGTSPIWLSVVWDVLLLGAFIGQHWLMARPSFKTVWKRWIPEPMERSTYVLMTCIVLIFLFWLWQPIRGNVWSATGEASRQFLVGVYLAGWTLAIAATFPINHWELFGIRQAWLYWSGVEYKVPITTPSILYRVLPHPIFVGYGVAVWAAPQMGTAHFLLSSALTLFLLIDLRLQETNLTN